MGKATYSEKEIAALIRAAVRTAVDACAKIADRYGDSCGSRDPRDIISARTGQSIAQEIRESVDAIVTSASQ